MEFKDGICWYIYSRNTVGGEGLCGVPCVKYKVTKSLTTEMYLCEKHAKYMEKNGYFVTKVY